MNDNMSEFYEERCAILQFEAGLPKEKAEALARAEVETWRKSAERVSHEA